MRRLQAEYDAAPSAVSQALLLHEVAVLEERLGEEAESIRDHLGATDAEPSFHEPLERLARVVARRRSSRLLGKLLERLSRIAESPSERGHAFVEHALHLADGENDLEGARAALESAVEATPGDPTVWLALELVAGRLGDAALDERALSERLELAEKPAWQALLAIDAAERLVDRGEVEEALRTLARARGEHDQRHTLSRTLEWLGRQCERLDVLEAALGEQAELVVAALGDPARGEAAGVPVSRRTSAHAADLWLQAAELAKRSDLERGAMLLDRALEAEPQSLLLARMRLELFEGAADTRGADHLMRPRLQRGDVPAELAAAYWLRLARGAELEGEHARARAALDHALDLAPDSVAARALELEWLEAQSDRVGLVRALERRAERAEPGTASANAHLELADLRGRKLRDLAGAEAALDRALAAGAAPERVLALGRLLAAEAGEPALAERLLALLFQRLEEPDERARAGFELARAAARRRDAAELERALARLGPVPNQAWLSQALTAYAVPLTAGANADGERVEAALSALSELEPDAETARALRLLLARRALGRGATEAAANTLSGLASDTPGDLVAGGMLAALLTAIGRGERAADVLSSAAAQPISADVAAALELAAGVRAFRADQPQRARECFERAAAHRATAAAPLVVWSLAGSPLDPALRGRELDALAAFAPELAALERFALSVGREQDPEAAVAALSALRAGDHAELRRAGELAAFLYGVGEQGANEQRDALEALVEWSPVLARLALAVSHRLELFAAGHGTPPDPERARVSATRWAEVDPGAAPVLEWLAAAIAARDVVDEVAARRALAERVSDGTRDAMLASAVLAAELGGLDTSFAPESDAPAARLVELELAPPGRDPARRARALEQASPLLGDDAAFTALVLAGYNQLAAGDANAALATFRRVVDELPDEVVGWEGLRAAAVSAGERPTLAEACAALGDAVSDPTLGAKLWEEAAKILLDELGDAERGEFALTRAVERDVRRKDAFWRAFRAIRARKAHARLIELIDQRLAVVDEPAELVKLLWERARSQRELGDRDGARRTLEQVQALEPDHVGALALSGEIHLALGRFAAAAESLSRLAQSEAAPAEQRLMSGIAAADVYETRLSQPERAFSVLAALERAGLSSSAARERLARTAVKAERYDEAVRVLEALMTERDTSEARAAAARLATAIYREKLGTPAAAERAVTSLLGELPDDPDGLDLVLSGVLDPAAGDPLLERGLSALVRKLTRDPFDRDNVERLARVSAELGLAARRQAALGALVALGADKSRVDPELWALDRNVEHIPRGPIDTEHLPALLDPEDHGPIGELARLLDVTVAEALGPTLSTLGVGRRERLDAKNGGPLRAELTAWAAALGIDELELYVGGANADAVTPVPGDRAALVVGSAIASPLTARQRQAVARGLFALRRGLAAFYERDPLESRAIIAAGCRLGEATPPYPAHARDAELQTRLQRELPRKVRRALPDLVRRVLDSKQDPLGFFRATRGTLDRLGAVAAGDVSWVLAPSVAERGAELTSDDARDRAQRLLAFVLSDAYLELRERVGMGVR